MPRTLEAIAELRDLFEKMGRVQYEIMWFIFGVGQLGAVGEIGDPDDALTIINNLRGDILDYAKTAKELSEQMEHLVGNVEAALQEREAKQNGS